MDTRRYYLKMERPVYQSHDVDATANRISSDSRSTLFDEIIDDASYQCRIRNTILQTIPSITWLSNYNWKDDLIKDIISGCTVAIMNIPQGMGYALLANVPPVVGIYMAFFPVIVYAFLGTSRHISMGSFAVVCLMTGKVVLQFTDDTGSSLQAINGTDSHSPYSAIEVATAVSLMVGFFQLVMYVCQLGVICSLLSDTLVSGFTAGAGIHVLTSQIKDIFGFRIKSHSGRFQNVLTYFDIFSNIKTINWMATAISVITIIVLVLNNSFLKPWISKKCIIPVPIELIVVLSGTIVSQYFNLSDMYDLKVVGQIPIGIPTPKAPPFGLLSQVASSSLIIAIIAYIVSVSMALIFAQKNKYDINSNQELLAQGAANLTGAFFNCAPISASLSRSAIQESVGGKTQLASLVSSSILLIVLLWAGPFFELLPRCVLASLIVVALTSILQQVTKLPQIWRLSLLDGIVWLVTYVTVVIVEIDIGLLVGLCFSIVSLLIQGMKPYYSLLSRVPGTDIYVDRSKYTQTIDPQGGKIIRYAGGINFANRGYFKNGIYSLLNIPQTKSLPNGKNKVYSIEKIEKLHYVILDISGIHYMDPSGAHILKNIAEDFKDMNISFYIAGTSDPVYESLKSNELMEANLFSFFPTVHDAVLYAQYTVSGNPVT